jgi:uncharacterized protein
MPLFPLGTVLYPGLLLPLHIFEDRYRRLVADLVAQPENEGRRFGVVAIREGREVGTADQVLHEVGCTAELRQVEAYEDGRYDIVATGTTRFRLLRVEDSAPYLQAEVEPLEERPGPDADLLAPGVQRRFHSYRDALLGGRGRTADEPPQLPDDPALLSYLVAAAMVLDLSHKQRLLAAEDVSGRLREELELLGREAAILRHLPSVPAVELLQTAQSAN